MLIRLGLWGVLLLALGSGVAVGQGGAGAASPSPSPTASPSPGPTPDYSLMRVKFAFTGDGEGRARRIFYSIEPGVFFYVRLHEDMPNLKPHSVIVAVLDPTGEEVARLGGRFRLKPGQDLSRMDFPRDCAGDPGNGLAMAGGLARIPGRYRARVFLDGHVVRVLPFRVEALRRGGRVQVVEAHLEDSQGNRRTTFTTAEQGVYARVSAVNRDRGRAHDHLVLVTFTGPDGPVGRALGGRLHVPRGALLDGTDLPAACDPQGQDGLRIRDTLLEKAPGPYHATVYLDGQVYARLPFRLIWPHP